MDAICLPADLERFARDCVVFGRYGSVAEVVVDAMTRLRLIENKRADLLRSVLDAKAEGDRDGYADVTAVERDMRQVIEEAATARP